MDNKISYQAILAAKAGDSIAMEQVLRHYDSYITMCAQRTMTDEYGNHRVAVDMELKGRLQSKLMLQIIYKFYPTLLPEGEVIETD